MSMKFAFAPLCFAIAVAGCGGGGGSSGGGSGTLNLSITDAPVDEADAVVVVFTGVELKPAAGDSVTISYDTPRSLNLLDLQGTESAPLLEDQTLAAGEYNWIRLAVDESASYIEIGGQQFALEIPSAAQTGLKLNRGFTIGVGTTTDFTIDFDLRKSVHQEGTGDYKLRPTLRIVDNLDVSAIYGSVDAALITAETCSNGEMHDVGNLVYLFAGADTTPNDVSGSGADPLTSASVTYDAQTNTYNYVIGFVPAGDYTVAFTCDGSIDDPLADDDVVFSAERNVTVVADTDSTGIDLPWL